MAGKAGDRDGAAAILACVAGAVSAVGVITTAEKFPGEGRISGLALGATTATAIFGGLTPYVAQVLTERTGWIMIPGAMIAVVAVVVLPILISDTGRFSLRGLMAVGFRASLG